MKELKAALQAFVKKGETLQLETNVSLNLAVKQLSRLTPTTSVSDIEIYATAVMPLPVFIM